MGLCALRMGTNVWITSGWCGVSGRRFDREALDHCSIKAILEREGEDPCGKQRLVFRLRSRDTRLQQLRFSIW